MPDQQSITFDFVDRPRTQVTKDRAYTLQCRVWFDGAQQTPTSATVTIQGPAGSDMPDGAIEDVAVTAIDGNGTMSYDLTAAQAALLGANYTAVWKPVISGTTYDFLQMFDVVRYPFHLMTRQADLEKHHPDLTDYLFSGETDLQGYVEQAFEDLYLAIEARGDRPYLVLSSDDLRRPTEHLALAYIFLARRKEAEDRWDGLYQHHIQEYHRWWGNKRWVYDTDESGTASGTANYTSNAGEEGGGGGGGVTWKV